MLSDDELEAAYLEGVRVCAETTDDDGSGWDAAGLRAVEAAVRAEMAAALNESFLHMRDRTAGYVGAAPVARFFHDGAAAFEWAATQARRAGTGEPLLVPPAPAALGVPEEAEHG